MVVIPPQAGAVHWVRADDAAASALIRYTGAWSTSAAHGQAASDKRAAAAHDHDDEDTPLGWTDSNGSLSVAFDGTAISLMGGMSFAPTPNFASCTIDGGQPLPAHIFNTHTMTPTSEGPTGDRRSTTGTVPLCHITGLVDGPHVLTFNITDIASCHAGPSSAAAAATAASHSSQSSESSSAGTSSNRLWIDAILYGLNAPNAPPGSGLLAARQAPTPTPTSISMGASASATSSAASNNNSNSSGSSKSAVRIGEIAGGIIGGALLVVFLRGVFFFVQRNDGTRVASGRPPSPEYPSGWTLPSFMKKGRDKGGLEGADGADGVRMTDGVGKRGGAGRRGGAGHQGGISDADLDLDMDKSASAATPVDLEQGHKQAPVATSNAPELVPGNQAQPRLPAL